MQTSLFSYYNLNFDRCYLTQRHTNKDTKTGPVINTDDTNLYNTVNGSQLSVFVVPSVTMGSFDKICDSSVVQNRPVSSPKSCHKASHLQNQGLKVLEKHLLN